MRRLLLRGFIVLTLGSVAQVGSGHDTVEPALGARADTPKSSAEFISHPRVVYTDGLHNENTELHQLEDGRILLAFRGGESGQTGSARAHIKLLVSSDQGRSFAPLAEIAMPDRDIRDPKLVEFGGKLLLYAIARVPGFHLRDFAGQAWTVRAESTDGGRSWTTPVKTYSDVDAAGTETFWSFWRFVRRGPRLFATAYTDGDITVGLFSSHDGASWLREATIIDSYNDIPSEAELRFLGPGGKRAVALVRLDNQGLLDHGQTAVCTSPVPFTGAFECGRRLEQRLDGPTWQSSRDRHGQLRHFVYARKSLSCTRKRTAVYELRGDLTDPAAPVTLCEIAELPSSGDTAYTAVAPLGGSRHLLSWYSTRPELDVPWLAGQFMPSDIWLADIDYRAFDAGACRPPAPDPQCEPRPLPESSERADASGQHLLTVAPVIWPEVGVFFAADVTVQDGTLSLALQPLDQQAFIGGDVVPVGEPIVSSATVDVFGRFSAAVDLAILPAQAFPIAGADLPLVGFTLTGVTLSPDSLCGQISGRVQFGPGPNDYISLDASTFGSARVGSGLGLVAACPLAASSKGSTGRPGAIGMASFATSSMRENACRAGANAWRSTSSVAVSPIPPRR
jgi:hypothetical protein